MRGFLERHFEGIDRFAVVVIGAALFGYGHFVDRDAMVVGVLSGNRAAIYGTIARLFATVFGFGLTATSIVLAFAKSSRLDTLRQSMQWGTLWRVFIRGLGTFLIVTIAGFLGMLFDRDRAPQPLVAYAVMLLLLLGGLRLYRLFWAFKNLMLIMTRPERNEHSQTVQGPERPTTMNLR